MSEHLISLAEAETNLTAAATYLAENIGSSDGHAEAMKEIVAHHIEQEKVDLAAELADTIKDNFVRDNLLVKIAEKCAAMNDDEYAFQLSEAIEDYGLQFAAQERIVVQKALRGEFDEALKIADELSHPDEALATIAIRQMIGGQENEFRQTLAKIDEPATKAQILLAVANYFHDEKQPEKVSEYLAEAAELLDEIEVAEEKIRTMLAIAGQYIEAAQFEDAVEILEQIAETSANLDNAHRESFLSAASLDFLRADRIDLADQTLDLIHDKTQIAATLAGFAAEFDRRGERDDALESLEEAYAVAKSQKDTEVRDSRFRFNLLNSIAVRFATLEKNERAMEIALENPIEDERNNALMNIAMIDARNGKNEQMRQSLDAIKDDSVRAIALINVSDELEKAGKNDEARTLLDESYSTIKNVTRPAAKANLLNEIAKRFYNYDDREKAREIVGESLQSVKQILDESHRALGLLHLAGAFEFCKFELNEPEKLTISTMVRKAEW